MKNSSNHLIDYSNSDYTGDITICWSTAKYMFYFAEDSIVYKLSLLKIITLFTIKSEYMMLCMAVQKTIWIRGFLNHINHTTLKAVIIYKDNQSIINLTKNSEVYSYSKHIDVCFH